MIYPIDTMSTPPYCVLLHDLIGKWLDVHGSCDKSVYLGSQDYPGVLGSLPGCLLVNSIRMVSSDEETELLLSFYFVDSSVKKETDWVLIANTRFAYKFTFYDDVAYLCVMFIRKWHMDMKLRHVPISQFALDLLYNLGKLTSDDLINIIRTALPSSVNFTNCLRRKVDTKRINKILLSIFPGRRSEYHVARHNSDFRLINTVTKSSEADLVLINKSICCADVEDLLITCVDPIHFYGYVLFTAKAGKDIWVFLYQLSYNAKLLATTDFTFTGEDNTLQDIYYSLSLSHQQSNALQDLSRRLPYCYKLLSGEAKFDYKHVLEILNKEMLL